MILAPCTSDASECADIGFLPERSRATTADQARNETDKGRETMADYANPDALVETDWLEGHLDDADIRVDRGGRGHRGVREGAHPWRRRLELDDRPAREGRPRLPEPARSSPTCCPGPGSSDDTTVVLYGGNNNWFAAYAYWILKLRGFDNVKLVNGGRKKWELESRELTQDLPLVPGDAASRSPAPERRGHPRVPRRGALEGRRRRRRSWTCARRRSTAARSSPPTTCPRSRRRCRVTSPGPRTSRGQGGERRRHVQDRGRAARRSMRPRA